MNNIKLISVPFDPNVPVVCKVGECFTSESGKHFYKQRENDVLHINITSPLINSLYVNYLTDEFENFNPVTPEVFSNVLKNALVNLKIEQYV